ncbi:unnamed protein product [Paramecium primaurelia]|uniref:BTB domain-containing protein n=1 Tax=Paramecium primaurelia TaxID=5886 RepID=A0A8S1N7X3_PARPR|nr:unnamed protein product [Paramecium primaurelia]
MLKKRGSDQLDIIFEAGEDLMNSSKNQVIILKNNSIRLPITKPRTFLSYSLEFCGITGLNYKQLRFQSLGRDIRPETSIMTASLVKVIHTNEFNQMVQNPLKTSLQNLFLGGIFSDVILKINDEIVLPLHKCILSCRSPKFNGMFSSNLMENTQNIIKVEYKKPELFKLMLGWIYSGYWKEFPDNIADACDLMLLADEYMIMDLKQKCEEDIISKLDISNILQVLLFVEKYCDILSPIIVDKAHSLFIDDFDQILRLNPNLEQDITKVPGLMTKLFLNYHQKKIRKARKVHFVVEDFDQQESDSDYNSQDYVRNYTQNFYQ